MNKTRKMLRQLWQKLQQISARMATRSHLTQLADSGSILSYDMPKDGTVRITTLEHVVHTFVDYKEYHAKVESILEKVEFTKAMDQFDSKGTVGA